MKKTIALLLILLLVLSAAACGGGAGGSTGSVTDDTPKTGVAAINVIGEDGIDWNHM